MNAHFNEHSEPKNVQKLHANQECKFDPNDRLEVHEVRWESHLRDDRIDAHGQDGETSVCP